MPSISSVLAAVAATSLISSASAIKSCPPLGPVLPAPQAPSKNEAVQAAAKGIASALDEITGSLLNNSALSIGVKSVHEDNQLFKYHFTPPNVPQLGTDKVDENTIYRVGSVSKMMPAIAALQSSAIDMNESVLKYLPELRNATGSGVSATHWEDITVGSLANHLSGLSTDMATDLGVFPVELWQEMGLPEIPQGTGPTCSGLPPTKPCSREDLIKDMARRPPVFTPESSAVYSNIGFGILGMVVEAATGQRFEDYVKENVWDVAGMKSTSFNGPVEDFAERGYIPDGEPTWNGTLGVMEAAGGMFSNTVDLLALADAIQKNELLSAAKTRAWMKPESHTASAGISLGASWEILRSDNLTSDGRMIDVYTKTGDLGLYHAHVAIVPDYDISVAVLTAGVEVSMDALSRSKFLSIVLQNLLPAIEAAGKDDATRFEGTYRDADNNATLVVNSDDGYGLLIEDFTVRGFDVLHNIPVYSVNNIESGVPPADKIPPVEGRLIPTKRTNGRRDENATTETAWRAIFDTATEEQKKELDSELFWIDASCDSFFGVDRASYNHLSLSDFTMVEGAEGEVKAIKHRAFNVTLTKVSGSNGGDGDDGENSGNGDSPGGIPESAGTRLIASSCVALGALLLTSVLL